MTYVILPPYTPASGAKLAKNGGHHSEHRDCVVDGCKRKRLNAGKFCYIHANKEKSKTAYIYFILAAGVERVKIGYARDIKRRVASLQTASPVDLVLVTHFRAVPEVEAALHKMLWEHRIRGEWFDFHNDVIDVMEIAAKDGWDGIKEALQKSGHYHAGLY